MVFVVIPSTFLDIYPLVLWLTNGLGFLNLNLNVYWVITRSLKEDCAYSQILLSLLYIPLVLLTSIFLGEYTGS